MAYSIDEVRGIAMAAFTGSAKALAGDADASSGGNSQET